MKENKKEAAAVASWNEHNPVGIAVSVLKDDGDRLVTFTTSKAHLLNGHTAVIWLKGISGCYKLDRVTPIIA